MGGAFGGKEVQANPYAAIAALGAWKTKRPVRVRLSRELDIALTGKRHPYLAKYAAGFRPDGRLTALRVQLFSDGGWSLDLSEPVMWRSMFHVDNAYKLPAVVVTGRVCRTHKTSQTAFRGFGGPQGMLVVEEVLGRAAQRLNLPADVVRERNFYREGDHTHYGERVADAGRIERIWTALKASSGYDSRRLEVAAFNARSRHHKRGIAITPVKFGISFTATFFNQAGAFVLVFRDGTVQVNHGGTEMGQGLATKILQIAADALGLPASRVRVMPTRTDKVPNTSATAASSGSDLNGAAVEDACAQIKGRLAAVAATLLGCDPGDVKFESGAAWSRDRSIEIAALCEAAYRQRVPLFAEGFYRTPGIHFDYHTARGEPFHYYAYGAAVSEVEVDGFTGQHRLMRTDILHDAGDSLSPIIDRGQIEGGFLQGAGWLTIEELLWDQAGRISTAGASTYKLPSWSEVPEVFNVAMLERANQAGVVGGSKAVGEPPLMLAFSVREAIREAIAAFGSGEAVAFDSPATPEFAVRQARNAAFGVSTAARSGARGPLDDA
jgi:xanthine dehydrogenase large subunit